MDKSSLPLDDLFKWHEALASCAIEGNKYAIEMLKLWDTDRNAFIKEILRLEEVNG